MRALFLAAATLPLALALAHVGSGSSPDRYFVKQIEAAIENYSLENDGALPERWSDLDLYLDGGVAGAGRHIEGAERYALLSPPVPFSEPFEGELLVVTRRAFREISRPDRPWPFWSGARLEAPHHHAVLRSPYAGITRHVFTEDEMRAVYSSAGVPPAQADSLPERKHIASTRRGRVAGRIALGLVAIGGLTAAAVAGLGKLERRRASRQAPTRS